MTTIYSSDLSTQVTPLSQDCPIWQKHLTQSLMLPWSPCGFSCHSSGRIGHTFSDFLDLIFLKSWATDFIDCYLICRFLFVSSWLGSDYAPSTGISQEKCYLPCPQSVYWHRFPFLLLLVMLTSIRDQSDICRASPFRGNNQGDTSCYVTITFFMKFSIHKFICIYMNSWICVSNIWVLISVVMNACFDALVSDLASRSHIKLVFCSFDITPSFLEILIFDLISCSLVLSQLSLELAISPKDFGFLGIVSRIESQGD